LTQSPQLKEATADNTTDVLLHRQLIVKVEAEISYDRDRLDDERGINGVILNQYGLVN